MIKELIVKIKTIFEGDGGQSVIQPVKELTDQTNELAKATDELNKKAREQANIQAKELFDRLAQKTDDAAKKTKDLSEAQSRQIRIANQLTAASMGSKEAIAGLARELAKTSSDGTQNISSLQRAMLGFSNAVAKAGLVVSAAFAGWNVGTKIQTWLWDLVTKVNDVGEPVRKTKAEFDALNNASLEKLKNEVGKIIDGLNDAIAALDKAARRTGGERSARRDAEIAAVEAEMPAGTERDTKIATIQKRYADEEINATVDNAQKKEEIAQEILHRAEKRRNQINIAVSEAENRQAEIESTIARRGWAPSEALLRMRKEAQTAVSSAREAAAKHLPDVENQITSARETIADERSTQTIAWYQSKANNSTYQASLSEIEKKQQEEAAKKAAEAAQKAAAMAAEKRRVERAQLEAKLAGTRPSEATGISRRLAELDEADISAAAADSPAKQAVLEQDKAMARAQREKDLRATLEPQYEKLKSTRDSAINEGLEAAGARERMRENPRDKGAKDTYEKESKEAQKAQAEFEKAMRAFTSSHEATMGEIVKFLQQAEQKNKQTKDKISRLPI